MNSFTKAVFVAFIYCSLFSFTKQQYTPDWASIDSRPLPAWYDESKVGLFVHYGVFSVPAISSEWVWWAWKGDKPDPAVVAFMNANYPADWTYADFARELRAEFFDPNEWADIFAASGAKYIVFNAKHHEGYTMWPSKYSFNWNVMDVGPKRDILGDLANALRNRTTIEFGIFYSMYEWFNQVYLEDKKNGFNTTQFISTKTLPELYEVVEKYQPSVIWSGGDWDAPDTYWNSTEFLAWLYNESPVKDKVVVNDRWGAGTLCKHGGFYTCSDRYNPGYLVKHKFEDCFTIDRHSWGYLRTSGINDYLTIQEIINQIVTTVSIGGNALVNIGLTSYGKIVPIYEERLRQMGSWLNVNGEAIYASVPWKYQNDTTNSHVWYTQSKDNQSVYATLLNWPNSTTEITLGAPVTSSSTTVNLLGFSGGPLTWRSGGTAGGIVIDVSNVKIYSLASDWAWVFKLQNVTPKPPSNII